MKISISIKVLFWIVLVLLMLFGAIGYVVTHELQRGYLDLFELRSMTLAKDIFSEIRALQTTVRIDRSNIKEVLRSLTTACQQFYEVHNDEQITHIAIIDTEGKIIAHNDHILIGEPIGGQPLLNNLGWRKPVTILDITTYHTLLPILNEDGMYLGAVDIGFPQSLLDQKVQQFSHKLLRFGVTAFFLITGTIILIIHFTITQPIRYLSRIGARLVQGTQIQALKLTKRNDEIADLGQTFINLAKYLKELTDLANQIASGDLQQSRVQRRSKQDLLGYALQEMLTYLQSVATLAKNIAEGDLSMMVPLRTDHDRFGRALQKMVVSLRQMAEVATNISTGDLRREVSLRSDQDVLGIAFQRMTAYLNRLANAATAIAAGDLQQDVQPETEHDVLGNAFHTMAVQLRENFEKIQQEVTERTRAQEALQTLNDELEDRVKERTAELAAANAEIRSLNDRLRLDNLRMSAELDVSRQLQQMILPSEEELQQIEEVDIVGFMKPADEIGGDYYDVIRHPGRLTIGIGDVTGHGLESGMLMLMTQTAIRALLAHHETDLTRILNTLNRTIYDNAQRMRADKTLSLALIEYQQGRLRIAGQHEDVLVVRRGGIVERIDTMNLGFPIGLDHHIADFLVEISVSLQPGDGIVLYTDGITEAENMCGGMYSIERLCEVVSRNWEKDAHAIKQAVIADVTEYIGEQTVYDDLTLIVLKQK